MKKISLHTAMLLRSIPIILFPLIFAIKTVKMEWLTIVFFIVLVIIEICAILLQKFLIRTTEDEMAKQAIGKADSICFRLLGALVLFAAAIFLRDFQQIISNLGWILATALAVW